MFPYSYRRENLNKGLNLSFTNVTERVKNQYANSYRSIVRMVTEQQYDVPRSYSKNDWKKVMIELQCAAYVKLRKAISGSEFTMNNIGDDALEYLKYDTISENVRVDWHDLYLRNNQSN